MMTESVSRKLPIPAEELMSMLEFCEAKLHPMPYDGEWYRAHLMLRGRAISCRGKTWADVLEIAMAWLDRAATFYLHQSAQ